MIDGRKACAQLCETSRLALYLARLGQGARLHRIPLFSQTVPGAGSRRECVVREGGRGDYGPTTRNQRLAPGTDSSRR